MRFSTVLAAITLAATSVSAGMKEHNCLADVQYGDEIHQQVRAAHAEHLQKRSGTGPSAICHDHWDYAGECGPTYWDLLDPKFKFCGIGQTQSPVDFYTEADESTTYNMVRVRKPKLSWNRTADGGIFDNGHTVQVNLPATGMGGITINGLFYRVAQFHFHAPSEHRIDGLDYPLEVHFVHISAEGKLAVMGVWFDFSNTPNPFFDPILANLPTYVSDSKKPFANITVDPGMVYDHIMSTEVFFRYKGSLTTPPCSEGVEWTVAKDPWTIEISQFNALKRSLKFDSRPVNPYGQETLDLQVARNESLGIYPEEETESESSKSETGGGKSSGGHLKAAKSAGFTLPVSSFVSGAVSLGVASVLALGLF